MSRIAQYVVSPVLGYDQPQTAVAVSEEAY